MFFVCTWIIFIFFHISRLTSGCDPVDYKEVMCESIMERFRYQTVRCPIPYDSQRTKRRIHPLYNCINWFGTKKYSVTLEILEVWGGCKLKVSFCLQKDTTTTTTTTPIQTSPSPTLLITTATVTTSTNIGTGKESLGRYIGSAVGGVVFLVIVLSMLHFYRKRRKKSEDNIPKHGRSVDNINYFLDARETIESNHTIIPVYKMEYVTGEANVHAHHTCNVYELEYANRADDCEENNKYNRISFSGKHVIIDPTYDHRTSVLAEGSIYNTTDNMSSEISHFVDNTYKYKIISRMESGDRNTYSDVEKGIVNDTTHDHLNDVQTTNLQLQTTASGQTSSVNNNVTNRSNDFEDNIYANIAFDQVQQYRESCL